VTALRYHLFDAEAARDRAEYATAIALATKYLEPSKEWPPVRAELLYTLGTAQSQGGDNKQSLKTLREAAQLGEAQHADYITTNAWIQLAMGTTQDEGDATRGLEYVGYAEAALDRMGRPPDLEVMVDYIKGVALSNAGRLDEAEVVMQHAVELAETHEPDFIPQTIQGLGYLYEDRGRFADAVAAYRKAIDHLPKTGSAVIGSMIVFHERLAVNLSHLGKLDEALENARAALALAQKTSGADNLDIPTARLQLAQVLQDDNRLAEATTESETSIAEIAKIVGERNERYGEALMMKAAILSDQQRWTEAMHVLERACEIVAFTTEDGSPPHAECLLYETNPLQGLHRHREALAIIERILPIFAKAYGDGTPQYAELIVERGSIQRDLGHAAEAQADLEHAIALFEKASLEPGHTAAAEAELAKLLWKREPARAHQLLDDALAKFDHAIPSWNHVRDDAIEWRDTDGKPKHP
jgi:tetratricopeptide (TPR) repeat protein